MGKRTRKGKRDGQALRLKSGVSSRERFLEEMERKRRNSRFQTREPLNSRPGTYAILPYYVRGNYTSLYPKIFVQQRGQVVPEPISVEVINASYMITHLSSLTPIRFQAFHHILRSALYDKFSHKREAYIDSQTISSEDIIRMVKEEFEPILRTATIFGKGEYERRKERLINLLLATKSFCLLMNELGGSSSLGDTVPCPAEFRSTLVREILTFEGVEGF